MHAEGTRLITVWLVRHGRTNAPRGVALGSTDLPLNEPGRLESKRLAAELASRRLSRVVASDLLRARQTAEFVAAPHGVAVELNPDLRELDFGRWEGRLLSDLWVECPGEAAAWETDLRQMPSQFGESFPALEARVGRVAARLRAAPDRAEIAVVAHRGSLAVLHALLTGKEFRASWALPFEPASVTAVELAAT